MHSSAFVLRLQMRVPTAGSQRMQKKVPRKHLTGGHQPEGQQQQVLVCVGMHTEPSMHEVTDCASGFIRSCYTCSRSSSEQRQPIPNAA
jgi:hypothetical protein